MKDPTDCPYAATRATYSGPAGSAAYLAREAAHGVARDRSVWTLLDGLDLRGARVLDMGCGSGRDVAEMRRRGAAAWGLDASPSLLAAARARHGGPGWWIAGDMLSDEVPAPAREGLDLVWSQASLVHVPVGSTGAVLARWTSWLVRGGRVGIATKEGDGERTDLVLGAGLPRVMAYRRLAQVVEILSGLGLSVEVARSGIPGKGTHETFLAVMARKP